MKYGKLSQHKYFLSIDDLPIYNWNKIHETGDLSFLLLLRKPINRFQKIVLMKVWTSLKDQYLEYFGLGETMDRIVMKKESLVERYQDLNVNDNKDQLTFIDIEERELKEMEQKMANHKADFYTGKAMVEKQIGFAIDVHRESVREYFSRFKVESTTTPE